VPGGIAAGCREVTGYNGHDKLASRQTLAALFSGWFFAGRQSASKRRRFWWGTARGASVLKVHSRCDLARSV